MLPRKLRLSREAFGEVRRLKRAASPHFSVSYESEEGSGGGAAVVIAKKAAKLAVTRHLLKRRILAVARPYVVAERILIIHVRPGAAALPFPELKGELISLLGSILPTPNR
jgi:ribonuclease P protein component